MQSEVERYPHTGRFLMGRARHAMSEAEKASVEALVETTARFAEPHCILERGATPRHSTMLIEGFVLRVIGKNGRRAIVGMQVPGDFVDLHAFALRRLDHAIVSIGTVTLGYVPHGRIKNVLEKQPHLARLLWFSTLLDAAIHREWIVKLEQLTVPRRVAHIFAELWTRLDMVGLGWKGGVRVPFRQTDLADMVGSTPVHVSRALRTLREDGIGEFRRGVFYVPDRAALEECGAFEPSYLYGEEPLKIDDALDDVA